LDHSENTLYKVQIASSHNIHTQMDLSILHIMLLLYQYNKSIMYLQ